MLPESFRHELPAELGVVARIDGDGVVEPLPRLLHHLFVTCFFREIDFVGLNELPPRSVVDSRHAVRFVVNHEGDVVEARREPTHKQRHDRCLRGAAGDPYVALKAFEAQKLLQVMPLVHYRSVECDKRGDGRVCDFSDRRLSYIGPHSVANEPIDDGACLGVI